MPRGRFKKGPRHSEETKKKIGLANRGVWIKFNCDNCGMECEEKQSHYKKKKRHFCNMNCYSEFRKTKLPLEEQHSYKGGGMCLSDKIFRRMCRTKFNHAITDGRIKRQPCKKCGNVKSEGHHYDYNKPFDVVWLCDMCHHKEHKQYENPDLLNK